MAASPSRTAARVLAAAAELRDRTAAMRFATPVDTVYAPLDYAWQAHAAYIRRFATGPRRVVFLGMNPGPFGMAQTGVPFGEVAAVREWIGLEAPVERPAREHPKRPVRGFDCPRSEVSGRRLWALFAERFGTAAAFFREHFVVNYCPLLFMEQTGRNRTPDKLPAAERTALCAACDTHLQAVIAALRPEWVVGVGVYARERAEAVIDRAGTAFATVLHPSPASPAANRGWAPAATRQLEEQGVWSPT